jgi:uncharacterized membrane protein YdjX (TVP38/TMEM64 family)
LSIWLWLVVAVVVVLLGVAVLKAVAAVVVFAPVWDWLCQLLGATATEITLLP